MGAEPNPGGRTGLIVLAAALAATPCGGNAILHSRTGSTGIEFLRRDLTVAIPVELIEQRIAGRGEFAVIDAAVLVPILQRRGGGLIGGNARLVDRIRLIGREATG